MQTFLTLADITLLKKLWSDKEKMTKARPRMRALENINSNIGLREGDQLIALNLESKLAVYDLTTFKAVINQFWGQMAKTRDAYLEAMVQQGLASGNPVTQETLDRVPENQIIGAFAFENDGTIAEGGNAMLSGKIPAAIFGELVTEKFGGRFDYPIYAVAISTFSKQTLFILFGYDEAAAIARLGRILYD